MNNDELKKKICEILNNNIRWQPYYYISRGIVYEDGLKNIADALIAAGIGDVKEVEYQVKVLKRALRMTVSKIEYLQFQISTRQECPISVPDIEDKDCEPYVRRAEDELLFEEEKLKGGER